MPNLTKKKSDVLSKLVQITPQAMAIAAQLQELVDYCTDNGFKTGQANAIADADCVGENDHLDAAVFNAALNALNTLTLNNASKTALRKATRTPIPGA